MADTKKTASESSVKAERPRVLLTDHQAACELLRGLQLAARQDARQDAHCKQDASTDKSATGDAAQILVSEKMFCSYCEANFTDRVHQKSHYKTDWHRYNLRQKLKGLDPISEDKFEELVAEEISSISGSDSSDSADEEETERARKLALPQPVGSRAGTAGPGTAGGESSDSDAEMSVHVEGIGRRHPRVFVRNDGAQLLSVYRCVVHGKKNQPENKEELISMVTELPNQTKWAVLMTAGGHFAAAIFERGLVVAHKTFHRYTVRAKRGTAQGMRDKQGNAPSSAGASLRRYNEAALTQEVSELIASWDGHMKTCDRIFLRAPSFNRAMFFGGKNPPLEKKDPRIRLIPFPTRRPTFSELQRVHTLLATVECYGEEETIHDHIKTSPRHTAQSQPREATREKQGNVRKKEDDKHPVSDDGDDEAEETHLVTSLEGIDLRDLDPFESTKKPKKKRKKKTHKEEANNVKKSQKETDSIQPTRKFSDEECRLRNILYTACKTGDLKQLSEILSHLLPADLASNQNGPDAAAATNQTDHEHVESNKNGPDAAATTDQTDHEHVGSNKNGPDAAATIDQADHEHVESNKIGLDAAATIDQADHEHVESNKIGLDAAATTDQADHEHVESNKIGLDAAATTDQADHEHVESNKIGLDATDTTDQADHEHVESNKIGLDAAATTDQADHEHLRSNKNGPDAIADSLTTELLNTPFGDSQSTYLHLAAVQNHAEAVRYLLEAGADPSIRDGADQPPYLSTSQKSVRNQFRQFLARYPDRYDYTEAQIPEPVSSEREAEKKVKEAERRKAAKKARKDRLKIKKTEESEKAAEQKKQERFLNLSEREKRALAAERRLTQQMSGAGQATPVLSRCWQCGVDITGKVPFEYYDYLFCTPKCLKDHKLSQKKS